VATDDEVDAVERTRSDELVRAPGRYLLRVLEEKARLPGERPASLAEELRGGEQHCRVAVVPAGVHDTGVLRRERHAALLVNRQRIDVCPKRKRAPRPPAPQARDDARRRRALELEAAERPEGLVDERRGLDFLKRQLGMRVEVPAPADGPRVKLIVDETAGVLAHECQRTHLPPLVIGGN